MTYSAFLGFLGRDELVKVQDGIPEALYLPGRIPQVMLVLGVTRSHWSGLKGMIQTEIDENVTGASQ